MDFANSSTKIALVLIARLCLGLFLLPSAIGKLTNLHEFVRGIVDYRILPESTARVFGFILPWIELTLAFALLLGFALRLAGIGAVLLFLCFITAVCINLRRGREITCNCYGIAGTKTISWGTIVRNVLLLLLAAVVVSLAPQQWFSLWQVDRLVLSSNSSNILVALLLAFCFVVVYLLEWVVDIHYRVSHLRSGRKLMIR
jgi:uncharacterized membrane protein YphA (DoxX/SURF4 family)